eukprot:4537902-Amphidinium_carterae.2
MECRLDGGDAQGLAGAAPGAMPQGQLGAALTLPEQAKVSILLRRIFVDLLTPRLNVPERAARKYTRSAITCNGTQVDSTMSL